MLRQLRNCCLLRRSQCLGNLRKQILERKEIISIWKILFLICLLIHVPLWMSFFHSLEIEKFGTLTLWGYYRRRVQPRFASVINLDSKQHSFFVIRAVLCHSATWLVVMAVPRSLLFCVLVELVFSCCFFKQGERRTVTLLWQFYLEDPWFSHYSWRHHKQAQNEVFPLFCFIFLFNVGQNIVLKTQVYEKYNLKWKIFSAI